MDVFEIQVAHQRRRMNDGYRQPRILRRRINRHQLVAAGAEEFAPANSRQARRQTIHPIADICFAAVRPGDFAREMSIDSPAAAALVPVTQSAELLVAFHFPVRSDDFVALVDRSLEVRRRDPIILKVNAHAVGIIDAHLHRIVSVYTVPGEPLLLADSRERNRFAVVIMPDQIDPMRADVAERIAFRRPLECAGRNLQRFLQIRHAVQWVADSVLDLIPNAQMVRVIPFVHINGDDQVSPRRQFHNLVRFVDGKAHRLFRDDMSAPP